MWKKTNSTLFLLRPIGLVNKKESLSDESKNVCAAREKYGLVNAYIADKDHLTVVTRPVFVLFRPKEKVSFNEFLDDEREDPESGIMEDYDYPEGHVVLLYKFPDYLSKDYDLLMQGKYSKTSSTFKSIFPIAEDNLYGRVFGRDKNLRKKLEEKFDVHLDEDAELWDIFDLEKETLNIDKILNHDKQ